MVTYFEATLGQVSVHRVGNKALNELYSLSENTLGIEDETLRRLLMQYFSSHLLKTRISIHFSSLYVFTDSTRPPLSLAILSIPILDTFIFTMFFLVCFTNPSISYFPYIF